MNKNYLSIFTFILLTIIICYCDNEGNDSTKDNAEDKDNEIIFYDENRNDNPINSFGEEDDKQDNGYNPNNNTGKDHTLITNENNNEASDLDNIENGDIANNLFGEGFENNNKDVDSYHEGSDGDSINDAENNDDASLLEGDQDTSTTAKQDDKELIIYDNDEPVDRYDFTTAYILNIVEFVEKPVIEILHFGKRKYIYLKGIEGPFEEEATKYLEDTILYTDVYLEDYVEEKVEDIENFHEFLKPAYLWLDIPLERTEEEIKSKLINQILVSKGYSDIR